MKLVLSRPIAAPIAFTLIVAAMLWTFDRLYGQKQVQMTRVGGMGNQCTCTQRIEK